MQLTKGQVKIAQEKIEAAKDNVASNGSYIEIEIDKMIKEILSNVKTNANAASKEQYKKLYESSKSKGSLHSCLLSCRTRASFDKHRTSFRFGLVEEIKALRREADKAIRKKEYKEARAILLDAFKMAVKFEDEFLSENRIVFDDLKGVQGFKRVSFSKKKGLKKAASSEDIIKSFRTNNKTSEKYELPFSIISTFGIRPGELQKGVRLIYKEGYIYAAVEGIKMGKSKGQEKRVIGSEFRNGNICDQILVDAIKNGGGDIIVSQSKKDYDALRRYLNRHHKGTSLYTSRHRVASDLKANGMSKKQIAEFLGHRTTDSQQYYGYARSGRGGRDFKAKATNEVREKPDIKSYLKPVTKPSQPDFSTKLKRATKSTSTPATQFKMPTFKPPGIK